MNGLITKYQIMENVVYVMKKMLKYIIFVENHTQTVFVKAVLIY